MPKEWSDIVIRESERAHATMGDEEARLRKAVEDACTERDRAKDIYEDADYNGMENAKRYLDFTQDAYDDAVFALNDAGYEE